MYQISSSYKNLLETSTSLKSKSKIIVDNQEYISQIKTYPKISHKTDSMFGGFPAKTCTFEIYDIDNSLDFEKKEINVYRGLEINGTIEWIPQGVFIPTADKIKTNITTKTISFNGIQDKSQWFDDKYESNLDWVNTSTHTGLEIVQEICTKLGITLETTTFNWSNYNFKQPNFSSNTTYREVISRLAEIGGSIAFISRNGGLVIKSQNATGHSVARSRYVKLSKEKQFGLINVVVLGKEGINDDIVYPNPAPETKIEWKILDNPFVDLYREEMIETVASYIIGQSIIPFEMTDFADGFYLDLNDTIQVTDKNDNVFNATILNYETSSRIKANISAKTQNNFITDYNLAGSAKKQTQDIKFDVDHIKKQIVLMSSSIKEGEEQIENLNASIELTNEQIQQNTNQITIVTDSLGNTYTKEEVNQLVQNSESGLTNIFSTSGGFNIFRNTSLAFTDSSESGFEFWNGTLTKGSEENSATRTCILLKNGNCSQSQSVLNGEYHVSFKYKKIINLAEAKVYINNVAYNLAETENETLFSLPIDVTTKNIEVKFECDTDSGYAVYELMVNSGPTKAVYSQNQNETETDTVNISKGIEVTNTNINTKTRIDADGQRTINLTTNEVVNRNTDQGTDTKSLKVQEKADLVGMIVQEVNDHIWINFP
jgi:hypothetical protein